MAASLIGSVAAGFGVVVLGTAQARGLAKPAIEAGIAGSQRVEPIVAEQSDPARTDEGQTIAANVEAAGRALGQRGANDGSQR